jgi:hypothetical protein
LETGDALAQDRRASALMDRTIHAAASAHGVARRVDDGVNLLRRDVCKHSGDDWHAISLPVRTGSAATAPPGTRSTGLNGSPRAVGETDGVVGGMRC